MNSECHTDHDQAQHGHSHHDLFGETGEMPAVFSRTLPMDFRRSVPGDELGRRLTDWLESLTLWAAQNHCFIGHIKVFAESEDHFRVWLSTTGKDVQIKNVSQGSDTAIRRGTAAVTAIVFGTDEKSLENAVISRWNELF